MRAMRFITAVLAALLLASCAVLRTSPPTRCPDASCDVTVTIVNGVAVLTPEVLEIYGKKKVHIYWKLPPGHEFDTSRGDGVALKKANDGEFSEMFETDDDGANPAPAHKPAQHFHWRDENSKASSYYYKIQFRKKGTGETFFKDPIIINSG